MFGHGTKERTDFLTIAKMIVRLLILAVIFVGIISVAESFVENIGATDTTTNTDEGGTGGADTGTNIVLGEESSKEIKIGTSKVINGVSIECSIDPRKNEDMVDDFCISDVQITDKKIEFSVENKDEDYAQLISTIALYCAFGEYEDSNGIIRPPRSGIFYPNHPVYNEKIKNSEILFIPNHKADLEANVLFASGNNIKKVLFYITPKDKIPMEMIEPYT